jgi:hypothetical protein
MASHLPPDLDRLGETLTEATARATQARRRQHTLIQRLAACVMASVLVFAATPAHLGPAQPTPAGLLSLASVDDAYGSAQRGPCDPPHGAVIRCLEDSPPPQAR